MAGAVCLRCDWQGESDGTRCPECSAPLYRAPAATARDPEPVAPETGAPQPRRSTRAFAAAFVATLVLALAAFTWVRAHTPRPPIAPTASAATGTLVYAVDMGDGTSSLWRWDLATGEVRPGPRVRDPIELVNASTADVGWVGVTSQLSPTAVEASVLRVLAPGGVPDPLLHGDLVAWGPGGVDVVAAKRSSIQGGCRRHVAIDRVTLAPETFGRQFEAHLCGDILSIGRGGILTYFTVQRRDDVSIDYVSVGRVHRVLRNFAMIGASPLGDLLVVPDSALLPYALPPFGSRSDKDPPPTGVFGTALFFRGLATAPIPYGKNADRFEIDRVMAWTPDGLTALVAGRLGEGAGLFEVDGGPGAGLRPPRFLGPIEGPTWATFGADGSAYVVSDRGISTVVDGRLVALDLPETAPAPTGPIVWLPPVGILGT